MHISKCLQKTPKLLSSGDYGVNIFLYNSEKMPSSVLQKACEDHTAVQAASEEEGKRDESF